MKIENHELRILRELQNVPDGSEVIIRKEKGQLTARTTYPWNPNSPKPSAIQLREIELPSDEGEKKTP